MRTTSKRKRGFTMIEAVIGICTASLVLAGIVTLMVASFTDAARGDARTRADALATYAANRIAQETREAKRAWFTPYHWEWGEYETLWIVLPQETDEGWYDRQQDGNEVAYFLWGDRLYRWAAAEGFEMIAEHVESIGFAGAGEVIEIAITTNVEGQESSQSERVYMRNS